MATSVIVTSTGGIMDVSLPFNYLDKSHVKAVAGGNPVTLTWVNSSTVRFVGVNSGVAVKVYRETPSSTIVTWSEGATILGRDLNASTKQAHYIAEEARDILDAQIELDPSASFFDVKNKRINNVASPTAPSDAATKGYVDTAKTEAINTAKADIATSVADALSSANTATTKANEAASSAASALASKLAAEASASSAAASVVAAASAFDTFDDRFLGEKAADPATDNDGLPLAVGTLYFNTVIGKTKVWNGVGWALAFNDTVAASAVPNDSSAPGANVAIALSNLDVTVSGKSQVGHSHSITDVTSLQSTLDSKLPINNGAATGTLTLNGSYVLTASQIASSGNILSGSTNPVAGSSIWAASGFAEPSGTTTKTLNLNVSSNYATTLTANTTIANPVNAKPGQSGAIVLIQDATGSRLISFGTNWKFPSGTLPTLSTGAGKVDILFYEVYTSGFIIGSLMKDIR